MDECDFCGVTINENQKGTCASCAHDERAMLIELMKTQK